MPETPAVVFHESPGLPPSAQAVDRSRRYTRILVILFLCTLPLVNPIVHGDGVGYYAYVRAPLIEHNFDFTQDYQHANPRLRMACASVCRDPAIDSHNLAGLNGLNVL
jgi:hypothetical protein